MSNLNGKWACAKGDKSKHFYVNTGPESYPACDPDNSRMRELTKGGNKSKCKACVAALVES